MSMLVRLLLPQYSLPWPNLPLSVRGHSEPFHVDSLPDGVRARVVLARWRQSAEMYLGDWRNCIVSAFADTPEVDVCRDQYDRCHGAALGFGSHY